MSANIDWTEIEQQVAALAVEILGGYEQSALKDFQTFRKKTETDLTQWVAAVANGEMSTDDLKELVEGQKNLLELHALKQWGLGKVALDKFVQGVTAIVISVISKLFS